MQIIAKCGWLLWRTIWGLGVISLVIGFAMFLEDMEFYIKAWMP